MTSLRAVLCLLVITGCASLPADPDGGGVTPDAASAGGPTCTADPAALTLRCVEVTDPIPDAVDDETRTELIIAFDAGAFDGASRTIAGQGDHVVTELSGDGLTVDESMTSGLTPSAANDTLVTGVLVWYRVHLLASDDLYERVDVSGTVNVDASGHGHVELSWTDPPSSYGMAGDLIADF